MPTSNQASRRHGTHDGRKLRGRLWTIEWLSSLDATGATPQRKLEVARRIMEYDLLVRVPFQTCYTLPNLAAGACGYLASKLKGRKWNDLGDKSTLHGAPSTNLALSLFWYTHSENWKDFRHHTERLAL